MKSKIFSKALVFLILVSSIGLCFNLGSYEKIGESPLASGKYNFEILLWTNDTDDINILIEASRIPDGWEVEIVPESIAISRSIGAELILRNGEYLHATPVEIIATPDSAEPGNITVIAKASLSGEGLGSSQERVFHLFGNGKIITTSSTTTVTLKASTTTTLKESGITEQSNVTVSSDNGYENSNALYFFIFVISIIILLICAAKVLKEGF